MIIHLSRFRGTDSRCCRRRHQVTTAAEAAPAAEGAGTARERGWRWGPGEGDHDEGVGYRRRRLASSAAGSPGSLLSPWPGPSKRGRCGAAFPAARRCPSGGRRRWRRPAGPARPVRRGRGGAASPIAWASSASIGTGPDVPVYSVHEADRKEWHQTSKSD
jgi:hypothetical protein